VAAAEALISWEGTGRDGSHVSDGDLPLPGEVEEQFLRVARHPQNPGSLDHPSGQGAAVR
jgi:hypothetical protein